MRVRDWLVGVGAAVSAAAGAFAQPGTFEVVDVTQPGWFDSGVEAVSETGWSAGWAETFIGTIVWRRSPQGNVETIAYGIGWLDGDTMSSNIRGDSSGSIFVNNSGEVAYCVNDGENRFITRVPAGSGMGVPVLGYSDMDLAGINDAGVLAGSGRLSGVRTTGFVGLPNAFTEFDYAAPIEGTYLNWVNDVNNAGATVGAGSHPEEGTRPFVYRNGQLSGLRVPSNLDAGIAEGISESGIIVGRALFPRESPVNDFRVVVWNGSSVTTITTITWTPPAGFIDVPDVKPYRINDAGRAVGHVRYLPFVDESDVPPDLREPRGDTTVTSESRGFITDGNRMYDLNTLLRPASQGWSIVCANDITNSGWIAASARTSPTGNERAVLLRPMGDAGPGGGGGGGGGGGSLAAPTDIVLTAASDTGFSNTDHITSAKSLEFRGAATAGTKVTLYIDGAATNRKTNADRNGRFTLKASGAPAGTHLYSFVASNPREGLTSEASAPVEVTRDAIIPAAPAALTLIEADAAGPVPRGANMATFNPTPTIRGTAEPGTELELLVKGRVSGVLVVPDSGVFEIRVGAPLQAGKTHEMTARTKDRAGNKSKVSVKLKVAVLN
ncbi:MAG: Ig-like domain-containing protein [Phycisphaerales bacterium]